MVVTVVTVVTMVTVITVVTVVTAVTPALKGHEPEPRRPLVRPLVREVPLVVGVFRVLITTRCL